MLQNVKYSVETNCRFASLALSGSDNEDDIKLDHSIAKTKDNHSSEHKNVKINETPIERGNPDSGRGRGRSPRVPRGAGRGGMSRGGGADNQSRVAASGRGRGGRGGNNRNRELDRHSGSNKTGVKPVPKKDGYGTGNWGTVNDEMAITYENERPEMEARDDSGNEENTAPTEPPVKTYSEYKAQSKKEVIKSTLSVRQPNDGANVFDKMIIKKKPEKKTEFFETKTKEDQVVEDDMPIHFKCINEIRSERPNQNRNTETRGGRGGGRGRGGRGRGGYGEGRGIGPKIPVPSIADVHDFPALA